jgi:hypothetical protein
LEKTLRADLDQLRSVGKTLSLHQTLAILVPLAVETAQRHAAGMRFYVHPTAIVRAHNGLYQISIDVAQQVPVSPRDRACLAPEERVGGTGNARANVYAIGALLYEMLTGEVVGPGMRHPTELVAGIPPTVEEILGKALVADPAHRPDDLLALAQALHHLAPLASGAPPPADESHLDGDVGFTVDVSMSMLPPVPRGAPAGQRTARALGPFDMRVVEDRKKPIVRDERINELSAVKAQLESDPRPRYVVVKRGMDHGPFSAVELLQQIATHNFVDVDVLRDSLSNDERPIKDWEQFAPFSEQARLHRDIKAEKEALERTVVKEQRSTRGKAFFGILAVGVVLGIATLWFIRVRGKKSDDVAVHGDTAVNVETEGALKGSKKVGGGRVMGSQGGFPMLAGGQSCESAQSAYVEEMRVGQRGQADITAGQYGAILNSGSYFSGCGVPDSMSVNICAAVQNGHAVGVSVTTNPPNGRVAGCVNASVRRLNFPSHPKLDVTRTTFSAAR